MEKISPYIFPLCRFERMDVDKYPYIKKYINITSDMIVEAISEEYVIDPDFVQSKTRNRRFVEARCALSYILYTYLNWTLVEIGTLLGGKDHSTVIYNRETFRKFYYTEERYKERADRIMRRVGINPAKIVA